MSDKNTGIPIGSLIGLKNEYKDRYILLHRNTFSEVLNRIARSNISNYSIFMLDDILFGFYDYVGKDFEKDMQEIAADHATREWWKLTEPMQVPLQERKTGEWWASMQHVSGSVDRNHKDLELVRKAFRFKGENGTFHFFNDDFKDFVHRSELFRFLDDHYFYAELPVGSDKALEALSNNGWEEMQEVFHTAGTAGKLNKKVFVTGCFDLLHSGHMAFLKEASSYGDLYVGIGSDGNVNSLKGRFPVNNEKERKFMLDSVRYVHDCRINKGWGIMDFLGELDEIKPDIFVVNEDGHTPEKEELCAKKGIEYQVLKRVPHGDLPVRSTTALRTECRIPFRIDLAGGWLDQPFVSKYYPGPVITISIEPTLEFNDRSGMASSTRRKAVELWKTDIPPGDPVMLAKMLFSFDNPPGTHNVSGSQDAYGIVLPGLNRLDYNGNYLPDTVESEMEDDILTWLENSLYLVTLGPRTDDYTVVDNAIINIEGAKRLSDAATNCWEAILRKDIHAFGKHFRASFEAQVAMFPNMADETIYRFIDSYRDLALGWKLSGAGGGGYLILVSDNEIPDSIRIKIRRSNG